MTIAGSIPYRKEFARGFAVVTGQTKRGRPLAPSVRIFSRERESAWWDAFDPVPHSSGNNWGIERRTLLSLGGFDERFGPGAKYRACEDAELTYRLLRNRVRFLRSPRPIVLHDAFPDKRVYEQYAFGLGGFCRVHALEGFPLVSALIFLVKVTGRLFFNWRLSLARYRAFFAGILA